MHISTNLFIENFKQSIEAKQEAILVLEDVVNLAANAIAMAFKSGNKLLICGNGGSAADSQHFAAEFTGRYEMERAPLPAIALTTDTSALTAIANDYLFDVVFSKQVEALGKAGDVLFAISTSGNSSNVLKAIDSAKQRGLLIIALTGRDGGVMGQGIADINICAPANRTARIQEIHLLVLHTICDMVDHILFKDI